MSLQLIKSIFSPSLQSLQRSFLIMLFFNAFIQLDYVESLFEKPAQKAVLASDFGLCGVSHKLENHNPEQKIEYFLSFMAFTSASNSKDKVAIVISYAHLFNMSSNSFMRVSPLIQHSEYHLFSGLSPPST